jgi:hypothetical protein
MNFIDAPFYNEVLFIPDPINDFNLSLPSMNEVILTSLAQNNIPPNFVAQHLIDSIINKWSELDYYSRLRINNLFLEKYPSYWIYDINNYDPNTLINNLLYDFPFTIRNSYNLSNEDIQYLISLDNSLSSKLKKKIKDECEKTKIQSITRKIWEHFNKQIINDNTLTLTMIDDFKNKYSQYNKDTDNIIEIYNLLKRCYKTRKSKTKPIEIDVLLGLFDGCDMDNFKKAIEEYEKKKKYLLH